MLNKAILMGRLTASPELKQTPSGIAVTSFSIAVDRNFTDKDGNKTTDFINIVAWRQTAEFICKHFDKGAMLLLEGSIQTRSYEDKQGNKRTVFEVVADQVYFCESKKDTASKATPSTAKSFSVDDFEEVDEDDGDLPF